MIVFFKEALMKADVSTGKLELVAEDEKDRRFLKSVTAQSVSRGSVVLSISRVSWMNKEEVNLLSLEP